MSTESLPEPPPAQPSFLEGMLEPAVKIASLIGIGLYVIGLLVFNVFLAKYGITDFAALKPGGGKPLSATLYFGADGQQLLKFLKGNAAPFHDDEPDNVIKSELMYATNDRYVFRIIYCRPWEFPATRENLRIAYAPAIVDKKLIQAVFYTGEKLFVYGDKCPFADKMLKLKVP